ncbi:MAG TPA: SAVED domain-containing protein [Clostridiaceae bacterium]|nr:SAVED domain-containing protein [Clostridiaceae bacterium]
MGNIEILKKYYKEICTPLIFVNETFLKEITNVRVYLYNFNKQQELENFKKVFQEYMAMYVRNDDIINLYDLSQNISEQLQKEFKKIYKTITPDRKTGVNGIFGELFNDYYLKNILNEEILLAYVSKKEFNNRNEAKGIDLVCCEDKDDTLEIILSEAKFVGNLNSAKNSLIGDISGETNHLNSEYINNYMDFVLNRQQGLDSRRKENITLKITEINKKIIVEDKKFIDAINELGYSLRFIYFAIFQYENNRNIENFKDAINEILKEFAEQVKQTGVNNYSMEIVFIPTFNTSMNLKNKMEEE